MSRTHSIYGLVDPRDNRVFYIGRTSRDPHIRHVEHMDDREGMSPKQVRIREIYEGEEFSTPDLIVLEQQIPTEKSAFTREVFWIELFTMVGITLTNASIDYNGTYFLSDYHLKGSQKPKGAKLLKKSVWSTDISKGINRPVKKMITSDKFFKIENYTQFTPISSRKSKSEFDFEEMRSINVTKGRLINYGFPITEEEVTEIIAEYQQNNNLDRLEGYFQRGRRSLVRLIEKHSALQVDFDVSQWRREVKKDEIKLVHAKTETVDESSKAILKPSSLYYSKLLLVASERLAKLKKCDVNLARNHIIKKLKKAKCELIDRGVDEGSANERTYKALLKKLKTTLVEPDT